MQFFSFMRLYCIILACLTLMPGIESYAKADCDSDIKTYNDAINRANALKDQLGCDDQDRYQRALVPLLSQALSGQEKVFANNCPLAQVGLSPKQLQDKIDQARSPFACSASERQALAKKQSDVEQALANRYANNSGQPVQANSSSCSDITGTDDTSETSTNCADGNTYLHAARVTRQKYGVYGQDQYKKAAESYRKSGDFQRAEAVLREAALSEETFEALQKAAVTPDQALHQAWANTGDGLMKIAQGIVNKPSTCSELRDAAALYAGAARNFSDAGELRKADEAMLRSNMLADQVDQLEREGRCRPKMPSIPSFAFQDKCQSAVEAVRYVRNLGGDLSKLESSSTPDCDVHKIDREMAKQCLRISLDAALDEAERNRRGQEFGCSFGHN